MVKYVRDNIYLETRKCYLINIYITFIKLKLYVSVKQSLEKLPFYDIPLYLS